MTATPTLAQAARWRPDGLAAAERSLLPMLGAVRPALGAALAEPGALARLGVAMAALPDALTRLFYLECRLGDDPALDLVVHVAAEARGTLAAHASAPRPPWEGGAAAWARVGALAGAWADPRSPLAAALHHVWLEFDAGRAPEPVRVLPGVFACFGEVPVPGYTPSAWLAHALAAIEPLFGRAPGDGLRAELARCFDALPAGAYVPYVGVMLGRGGESVRVCITEMGPEALARYLRAVGWSARAAEVESLVGVLARAQPPGKLNGAGMVHLDLAANGVWRLGLELACLRVPQLRGGLAEGAMLDALPALGLASAAKCRALREWPGSGVVRVPAAAGPRVVLRRLNHVKLVFAHDRAPEAKAYLAARHFPKSDLAEPSNGGQPCS